MARTSSRATVSCRRPDELRHSTRRDGVRVDLRRQSSWPRAAPRIRDLRRVERLLARGRAQEDADAGLHAHGGHRLVDARHRGGRQDRLRPRSHFDGARAGGAQVSGISACAGRRVGTRSRCAICSRCFGVPARRSEAGGRVHLLAWREIYPGSPSRCSRFSPSGFFAVNRSSTGSFQSSWRRHCSRSRPARSRSLCGGSPIPRSKRHRRWFAFSLVASLFFYTEFRTSSSGRRTSKELWARRHGR